MQIAVACAVITALTAFWFFTVQHHSLLAVPPEQSIVASENCGVALAQVPPVITEPTAQEALHEAEAPAPDAVGPVQET